MSHAVVSEPAPVRIRGRVHRQPKLFTRGAHRGVPPEETLERVRPHFRRMGLTRLADITGLDRIGIPAVLAIRPNAAGLSVDAGKGISLAAARASAAMEAIERWHAETATVPWFRCTYEELDRAVLFERLPIMRDAWFHARRPVPWTWAYDLVRHEEVAMPTDLVTLSPAPAGRVDGGIFQKGSNGLSAGNGLLEAIVSGLFEVIERDAVTCHLYAEARGGRPIPRVDLATVDSPEALTLLDRFARADVTPVVYDCTSDLGVPVYMTDLYDRAILRRGVFRGYGAHLDPSIALCRALTEAAQSRLVHTAGSRDDFFAADLRRLQRGDRAAQRARRLAQPPSVALRTRALSIGDGFEDDVHLLVALLDRAGLDRVLVHELTEPGFPAAVVRVWVPGLEGYYAFDHYAPGARARAFLQGARS